jgi:hypothetical protein
VTPVVTNPPTNRTDTERSGTVMAVPLVIPTAAGRIGVDTTRRSSWKFVLVIYQPWKLLEGGVFSEEEASELAKYPEIAASPGLKAALRGEAWGVSAGG